MTITATCRTCGYFKKDVNQLGRVGACEALPPMPITAGFVQTPQGLAAQVQMMRPVVEATMAACALHKPEIVENCDG